MLLSRTHIAHVVSRLACLALLLAASARPAAGVTYTWTGGGGADTAWSNKANWGGMAPADAESDVELVFPALAGPYTATNDLDGLQLSGLAITTMLGQGNYTFAGNAVALTGGATMDSPASGNPNLLWQIPLTVGADVTVATSGRQTRLVGPIDLGGHTLTLDTVGDLVLAGAISGSGALVKNNGSALSITGTNTYSGPTTNNAGALYINGPAALGDAAAGGTTINGGFLGFSPGSAFTLDEPLVFSGGYLLAYGTPTVSGSMTLDAALDVRAFDPSTVITIAGSISGTAGLSKSGPGLLVVNTASARYGGATRVDAGTLQLDATLVSAQPLTVKNGATLKGNGSCAGPIHIENGGTLAPGASPGGLSSGGLQMTAGAVYAIEIDGPDAVAQYDTLAADGAVALDGATLAVALGYVPDVGQRFTLIDSASAAAVGGTFASLPEGAALQVGSTTFAVTYQGGDVELVAGILPPPTATATVQSTATGSPAATATVTAPAASPTATPTPTGMPTTVVPGACLGDCDDDGVVGVHEIILGVSIALDVADIGACPSFDADGDGQVTVAALIEAVGNALDGCP